MDWLSWQTDICIGICFCSKVVFMMQESMYEKEYHLIVAVKQCLSQQSKAYILQRFVIRIQKLQV